MVNLVGKGIVSKKLQGQINKVSVEVTPSLSQITAIRMREGEGGNVIKLRFKYLGIEFLGLRNFVKKRTKFIKTLDKSEIAQ